MLTPDVELFVRHLQSWEDVRLDMPETNSEVYYQLGITKLHDELTNTALLGDGAA